MTAVKLHFVNTSTYSKDISKRERFAINRHAQNVTDRVKKARGRIGDASDTTNLRRDQRHAIGSGITSAPSLKLDSPKRQTPSPETTQTIVLARRSPDQAPRQQSPSNTFGMTMDPFDCLPLKSDPWLYECLSLYMSGLNLKPWDSGPQLVEKAAAVMIRTQRWFPMTIKSVATYSAMIAFLQAMPTLPEKLRNPKVALMATNAALHDLAAKLQDPSAAVSDETLLASALLFEAACNSGDLNASASHLRGLVHILLLRRRMNRRPSPFLQGDNDEDDDPDISCPSSYEFPLGIDLQFEQGYDQLYQAGFTNRSYRNFNRNLQGLTTYTFLCCEDETMARIRLEYTAISWLGCLTPERDMTRPFERALINVIMMSGYCPVYRIGRFRLGTLDPPYIYSYGGVFHLELFQGEGEIGLEEIGSKVPGVLVWMALIMCCFLSVRPSNISLDCFWMMRKALHRLGIDAYDDCSEYCRKHFTWAEAMHELGKPIWYQAFKIFPETGDVWTRRNWIRPREHVGNKLG